MDDGTAGVLFAALLSLLLVLFCFGLLTLSAVRLFTMDERDDRDGSTSAALSTSRLAVVNDSDDIDGRKNTDGSSSE